MKLSFIDFSLSWINGGAFFPLLIALFSSSKLSYKVRRFFTNVSLSNNYLYHRFFLLSSLWVKRFFHHRYLRFYLIFLTRLRDFISKGHWFSSCYPMRFGGFLPNYKVLFYIITRLSELKPKRKAILMPWSWDQWLYNLARNLTCDLPTSSS